MSNALDQLRTHSIVVADTADIDAIARYSPVDATTNPSLVLKQAKQPSANALIETTRQKFRAGEFADVKDACLHLSIEFGAAISRLVPGYVSTEVDARLSFNTELLVAEAHKIISAYKAIGIDKSRILIKLASTWEGIQAAKQLENEKIGCNLTLLFCEAQAIAAAQANSTLISPFVGRIYDWHVARGSNPRTAKTDPGVISVQSIHSLYKSHGISTIIMGASFRTAGQILALAGCDRLTISPTLLSELQKLEINVKAIQTPASSNRPLPSMDRDRFHLAVAADLMATEKLADGITQFIHDQEALETLISR